MVKNSLSTKHFLFIFCVCYLILFITNSHFNFQESLIYGGADGFSYYNISSDAPLITEKKITPIHSERFLFPYIIGLISRYSNIEIFSLYKFFVFVTLFCINYNILQIFNFLKFDRDSTVIILIFINFNPYISRFYIAIPTILNDLLLILGLTIVTKNLIFFNKKTFSTLFGLFISFASRQTSIALVISYLITVIISKKKLLDFRVELGAIILFIILFTLSIYYSNHTFDNASERINLYSFDMRILGLFLQNVSFNEKIIFTILPLLSFGPILAYLIIFREIKLKFSDIFKSNLLTFLFILILLIICQPILSGPLVTGRNVIRLTTLAYIPLIIFLMLVTRKKKSLNFKSKYLLILIFTFAFVHSLHPTFSNIKFFEFIKL